MNREQKLLFIKTQHPHLYDQLKKEIGDDFLGDVWGATSETLSLYNALMGFYCGGIGDVNLMNILLI